MKKLLVIAFLIITSSVFAGYPNFPNNYTGMVTLSATAKTLGSPDNPMSVALSGTAVSVSITGNISVTPTAGAWWKTILYDSFGNSLGGLGNPVYTTNMGSYGVPFAQSNLGIQLNQIGTYDIVTGNFSSLVNHNGNLNVLPVDENGNTLASTGQVTSPYYTALMGKDLISGIAKAITSITLINGSSAIQNINVDATGTVTGTQGNAIYTRLQDYGSTSWYFNTLGSTNAFPMATIDALGNTNGGIDNPYFVAINGYPSSAENVFENSKTKPMINDNTEAFTTTTYDVTTSSGGFYGVNITPTAGMYFSVKGIKYNTSATSSSGTIEFKFISSVKQIYKDFVNLHTTDQVNTIHIEGNVNEPITLNITNGGNAQEYFIAITYREE